MACNEDTTVLSFHDSLLRQSDVALLDGTEWLNDKLIGFYFEYLEYRTFSDFANNICFITPDVTQFIKLYEGPELGIFLEPLLLHEKELVLLAVNNNPSTEAAGGSHWSTLVYVREENIFHHLDSLTPANSAPARSCAQKITPYLREVMCKVVLLKEPKSQLQSISGEAVQKWRSDTKQLIAALARGE